VRSLANAHVESKDLYQRHSLEWAGFSRSTQTPKQASASSV
jgi:hypothetical protein